AGTVAYWAADLPIIRKVMPIALNVLALSMVVFGSWWRVFAQRKRFWPPRREPSGTKATPRPGPRIESSAPPPETARAK
ncbi:MAG: hypothetical protein L0027_09770, partial [Candidatus Rokubacteria bacterium]|nr:hypothetical protein [Candidatus Rokubacteria bacterium]